MGQKTKKAVGTFIGKAGVTFRVWAPFADGVAVVGTFNNWIETQLNSENDGYWSIEIGQAEAGQEYKFVIHKGATTYSRNDPRAKQLTITEGTSVIASDNFDWGEQTSFVLPPIEQQVIYELHIGTFNRVDVSSVGTFETATAKLEYLKELGITTIELMPVTAMSEEHLSWGYNPEYIYAVENLYGGRYELIEFVKAAHAKGIGVVLDVVFNHFGPAKTMDLWQFDGWSENDKGGIYFYNDWRSATPWGETRPDYGRAEVRQFLLDSARQWLVDFKLDGLRIDSTIFIRNVKGLNDSPDNDIADGWYFLQKLNQLAQKINPNALVVAEDVGANSYITKPVVEGGAGFKAQWQVNFPQLIRQALDPLEDNKRDITSIANELSQTYNGDPFAKVIYSDSHDSSANGGARLNSEISPNNPISTAAKQRSLIASAIVLTAPGVPMLLQGQEFLQGGSFNDWDALDWDRAEKLKGIVQANHDLIALRKNYYANTRGLSGKSTELISVDQTNKVIAYQRWDNGGPGDDVIVVVNFSNNLLSNYKIKFPRTGQWNLRFNSGWHGYCDEFKEITVGNIQVENSEGGFDLPPYCVLIFSEDS